MSSLDIVEQALITKGLRPITIRNNDGYCFYLPEWQVFGAAESLTEAYNQFLKNAEIYVKRSEEFGLSEYMSTPFPINKRQRVFQELSLFIIKIGLAVSVVILTTIALLPNISAAVRQGIKSMVPRDTVLTELISPKYWALGFPTQINDRLDKITQSELELMKIEWNKLIQRTVPTIGNLICQASSNESSGAQPDK
jgi:hypothetical protein